MSDSKKFNNANEKDLEQVAGGGYKDFEGERCHYRCPVCGNEEWVSSCFSPVHFDTYCPACRKTDRKSKCSRSADCRKEALP